MEGIEIRSVSAGDAEFLFQLMNEPAVMKALNEVPTEKRDWEEAISAWSAVFQSRKRWKSRCRTASLPGGIRWDAVFDGPRAGRQIPQDTKKSGR